MVRSVADSAARPAWAAYAGVPEGPAYAERGRRSREHPGLVAQGQFQTRGSLPAAAEQLHEPERPTAGPLSGTLLASLVGARLCRALGPYQSSIRASIIAVRRGRAHPVLDAAGQCGREELCVERLLH